MDMLRMTQSLAVLILVLTFALPVQAGEGIPAEVWIDRAREMGWEEYLPDLCPPLHLPPAETDDGALARNLARLLTPDEAWLCLREVGGTRVDLRCYAQTTSGVLVARSDEGLRFSPAFSYPEMAAVLTRRLRVDAATRLPRLPRRLDAGPLLLLRILHATETEMNSLLPEVDATILPGPGLSELCDRLQEPAYSSLLTLLPAAPRQRLSILPVERLELGRVLESLGKHGLVQRQILAGEPRYRLSPTGRILAGLLFAPLHRLTITRLPRPLLDAPVLEAAVWASDGEHGVFTVLGVDGDIDFLPVDPADPVAGMDALLDWLRETESAIPVG